MAAAAPRTALNRYPGTRARLVAAGLSRLAVKLIKAGVRPERIAPGKPQQNGHHERLHPTLKQDTAQPPARSLAEQIDRFQRLRSRQVEHALAVVAMKVVDPR